jgi:hypothetical protein
MTAQSPLAGFRAICRISPKSLWHLRLTEIEKTPPKAGTAAAFYLIRCLSSVAEADPDFSTSFARDLCHEEFAPHSRCCFCSLARWFVHLNCFGPRWWVRRTWWLRWLRRLLPADLLPFHVLRSTLRAALLPPAGLLPAPAVLPAPVLPLVIQPGPVCLLNDRACSAGRSLGWCCFRSRD